MTQKNLEFKVILASRYFKVYPYTEAAKDLCREFQRRYMYKKYRDQNDTGPDQYMLFAIALSDGSEFRYHRNTWLQFQDFLKIYSIKEDRYEVEVKALPELKKRNFKLKTTKTPRDYQIPIVDYLKAEAPTTKFIGIQPGEGKTYTSLLGVAALGYRTIVIVNAGLMKQWGEAIYETLDISKKSAVSVSGSKQLKGLIAMVGTKEYEKIDIILLSNTTLQNWLSEHESMVTSKFRDIGYGIEPDEFYEHLGIGHRIIDEAHMKFNLNYKQDLYTNTYMCTSLSATLFTYDTDLDGYYQIAYPKHERYNGGELKKYTDSIAVMWRTRRGRQLKTSERGRSTYSHTALEKCIMRDKQFLNGYAELIAETLELGYFANYKPGNKAAVYVSSIEMATYITKYLRQKYPGKTVERYVGIDPEENLKKPDIRVTTLGSAGTGHDIPGLTDTILTVGIMSLQSNIQVFGRTRFIPDQNTRFYYFTCKNIEKHMRYHELKIDLMEKRAKSFDIVHYNTEL